MMLKTWRYWPHPYGLVSFQTKGFAGWQTTHCCECKGFRQRAEWGQNLSGNTRRTYIGSLMNGTVSIMDVPNDEQLKKADTAGD
ncbi:MAG: hypothetical protein R2788_02705 [Saprospiraceae bacterium]